MCVAIFSAICLLQLVFGQKTDRTYTNISQKMLVLLSIYKISTLAKHQHLEL